MKLKLFKHLSPGTSQDRIALLEQENAELKQKLREKQLHINKTNSYWKGKMRSLQKV